MQANFKIAKIGFVYMQPLLFVGKDIELLILMK
jgi:hypothetical protein